MEQQTPKRPLMVFLMSDTGGGHRSAAEAVIEAIQLEFPDQIKCRMVDIFVDYAPPPLNRVPDLYLPMSKAPDLYELMFRISDGKRRIKAVNDTVWPYVRQAARRLVSENPCDLYVVMHPLGVQPLLRVLRGNPTPAIIVVTDLISGHAGWYNKHATYITVPTEVVMQRALKMGVPKDRIEVIGQPVAERFCLPPGDRRELRARLGWPAEMPVVLAVGGGEGMGPLEETTMAIDAARLPCALAVVCGRNQKLQQRLQVYPWHNPTFVYGFVNEMPDFMRAADVLVTKAGPGTICEGFIAGLPIILYHFVAGQEDGNIDYVLDEQAGVYNPEPEQVVETLRTWLEQPEKRCQMAENSKRLAVPDASRRIARVLAAAVGVGKG